MKRTIPFVFLAVFATGCPAAAPDWSRFAGDAASVAQDTAVAGADNAVAASDTAGAEPDSAAPAGDAAVGADAVAADVPSSDTGGGTGVCANGIGLYAKTVGTGNGEIVNGSALAADGGAVLVGDTGTYSKSDALLLKISAVGTTVWSKTFGGSAEDHGSGVLALADGCAVVGTTRSKGAGYGDGWLIRTDAKGVFMWDQIYGGKGDDALYGIAPAADGFVLAGMNRSLGGGSEDGWLVRTDAAGNLLWESKYGGSSLDALAGVVALPAGGFAAAGYNNSISSNGSDAWLLIVNANGKQTVEKVFGFGETDDAQALTRMPDGGFALTGRASNSGNPDLWVIRTDNGGNLLWKDVIGGNQIEEGHGIAALADGSLAIAGETSSPDQGGSSSGVDGWLLRYDAWGNRMWDLRFGDSGNQWLETVQVLADGGLLLAGRVFDQSAFSAWFLRTDAWGHVDCAKTGACKGKVDCEDGNACTVDFCDKIDGCVHTALAVGAPCGDGAVCSATACVGN